MVSAVTAGFKLTDSPSLNVITVPVVKSCHRPKHALLAGDSKLPVGVDVSVSGCFVPYD